MTMASQSKTADLVIIAPLGAPEKRPRLSKLVATLQERYGTKIAYWGWKRAPEESLGAGYSCVVEQRALLSRGGYRGVQTRMLYFVWVWQVFWAVLFRKPKNIYCLGLETALPTWLAQKIRLSMRYIFDDPDRLVMVWKLPKIADMVLRWCEKRVSSSSVSHIIPSQELYDFETPSIRLVRNMPNRNQIRDAKKKCFKKSAGKFVIYVNGELTERTNIPAVAQAARTLQESGNADIVFKVASLIRVDGWDGFEECENVEYLGFLPQTLALAHYKLSDVVLSMYDIDGTPSQRFAWPNKWGDAISMATPMVVTSGMVTARPLLETGAAFACPFGDGEALARLLLELRDNPERLEKARAACKRLQSEFIPYDEAMEPILRCLLDGDSVA